MSDPGIARTARRTALRAARLAAAASAAAPQDSSQDAAAGRPPAATGPALRRVVSRRELVALAIGDVVGSGIYLLPAAAVASLGADSGWAVLAAGLAVFLIVLCFAEAASLFDRPGSAYVYAEAAFGPFVGWQIGWMSWLSRVASLATLAVGFAQTLGDLWSPAGAGAARAAVISGLLGGLALLNIAGVKAAARTSAWLTVAKLVPLLAFVGAGAVRLGPAQVLAVSPPSLGGLSGGALLFLFSYAGFENTPAAAGEHRDPRRDVPFALLVQITAVTLLYFAVQRIAIGVWTTPDPKGSLAGAMVTLVGPRGGALLTAGTLLSIVGTNANILLAGPRFLYAIAHSGALPAWLTRVHPRFRTPHLAILAQVGLAIPLAVSGSFAQLAALSVVARLATYLSTAGAVIVLRRRLPDAARAVRLPLHPLLPILAMGACLIFFKAASRAHLGAAAAAFAVGALLWVCRRRSAA